MSGSSPKKSYNEKNYPLMQRFQPNYSNEPEKERGREPLRLDTSLALSPQFQSVSMVPTPLIPSSPSPAFPPNSQDGPFQSQRVSSASLVPDSVSGLQSPTSSRLHKNLLPANLNYNRPQNQNLSPDYQPTSPTYPVSASLSRGNSLLVPKRGDRAAVQLNRSASVGGPQRQPSTVLHREPKATSEASAEELPEEVYLASNPAGAQSAWRRIKFVGKGSFSEVVLSRPAIEFVKPEFAEQVDILADEELASYENENDDSPSDVLDHNNNNQVPSVLVAVKITTLNHTKTQAQLEYFRRDVDIMSSIPHHPSVMRIIGSSLDQEHHNRTIFVLPFCKGGDLFDLVAKHRSKLSPRLIRRLFADVCSAVVFLHQNRIVHRDIKLENVLLDIRASSLLSMDNPDQYIGPLAVLTDLGLARRIDPEDPMLTTRCGSDDYVPPEIMLGQPYDGRETDSWALGVLLYAMLEGRLPFDAPPHAAQHEGSRARLRTAHRIARVDWNWYKRKDETDTEWTGGKEIVDGCLKRRNHRRLASDTLQMPWVSEARPQEVYDSHNVDDLWQLFIQ